MADWCKPGQFICLGSSKCIEQNQVCDGTIDCEGGDDEKTCVTIAPDLPAANSLGYHEEGLIFFIVHIVLWQYQKICHRLLHILYLTPFM